MGLNRFGQGALSFDFTQAHITLPDDPDDNFDEIRIQFSQLPGVSGAFPEFGTGRQPTQPGTVTQELTLRADSSDSMDAFRDALNTMASWGMQPLFKRLDDYPTSAERFCYAFVERIDDRRSNDHNNTWQRVRITFRVPDPRWYKDLSGGSIWGVGEWDSATWGDAVESIAASGVQTDTSITYNGNVAGELRVEVHPGAGQAVTAPIKLIRITDGLVRQEITITESLAANEQMIVDARKHSVQKYDSLNGYVDNYNSNFNTLTADWLTLPNGTHTFRVEFGDSGDAAEVRVYYNEGYR